MFFTKPEFADEFTHTESTGPDVRNINQYSAEDLARKMCWQISSPLLVLVLVLAAHQCSASCFGKDAHFKATDVSLASVWTFVFTKRTMLNSQFSNICSNPW